MITKIINFGNLQLSAPSIGNFTLNLFPHKNLPAGFEIFQDAVNAIFSYIPYDVNSSNEHFVTIDSKYFPVDSALRREGLHIDGNFCVDPVFCLHPKEKGKNTWGGATIVSRETWDKTSIAYVQTEDDKHSYDIKTPFVNEFGISPPLGIYVSGVLGGIFCISDIAGCEVYDCVYDSHIIESEGAINDSHRATLEQTGSKHMLKGNTLYFMSSNTPHESLVIKAGQRRTLIRVTLAHDYPNKLIGKFNGK